MGLKKIIRSLKGWLEKYEVFLGGKMYYHVKIELKSNKQDTRLKALLKTAKYNNTFKKIFNLSEDELINQFIVRFENNEDIFFGGKTTLVKNIERMTIIETNFCTLDPSKFEDDSKLRRNLQSSDWEFVLLLGKDVTADFIKGPPGYKKTIPKETMISKSQSNQIFVVHGHDNEMKEAVARILEKLGFEAIILHEQAGPSKTIIEKFEACSESVSFAVVLLSPDDLGYKKDQTPESTMLRARQNVILELGYFMGKLSRKNVVVLHRSETNFELPSDLLGILYIPFDPYNGWKYSLAKELDSAGYDIDYTKL